VKRGIGIVLAVLVLVATGCSGSGGGDDRAARRATTTSTAPPPPTTTVPPQVVDRELVRLQIDDALAPHRASTASSESDFSHHQLMKMPTKPIRKASVRREQARQLAAARAFAVAHPHLRDAQADGYLPQNFVDADGVHVVDWRLVTKHFDPARPSMVIYESMRPDARIVALSYVVESIGHQPDGFAGPQDSWHQHLGLCFKDGLLVPSAFKNEPGCRLIGGRYLSGTTLWMLHAWVVPHLQNPWGVFAIVNPRHKVHD
jgi:hypothetical protein